MVLNVFIRENNPRPISTSKSGYIYISFPVLLHLIDLNKLNQLRYVIHLTYIDRCVLTLVRDIYNHMNFKDNT